MFITVIHKALREMLMRYKKTLEYRYKVVDWKEGDENFVPVPGENWMQKVTLPSGIGKL